MPGHDLAVVMSCYDQPQMMAKQVDTWRSYSDETKAGLKMIVVDDAGPEHPFELEDPPVETEVYRVLEDIPWNQPGARNLGMRMAKTGWALMIDPDMIIPPEVMARVVGRAKQHPQRRSRYRLLLRHVTSGEMDPTCCNIYMIHTDDFWSVGGYDEDYSGHKGYSDVLLHHVLSAAKLRDMWWRDCWADFHSTREIPDAMVTKLDRDLKHNAQLHSKKKEEVAAGVRRYINQPRAICRFTWTKVQ